MKLIALTAILAIPLLTAHAQEASAPKPVRAQDTWSLDFAKEADVAEGAIPTWAAKRGFTPVFGSPVYFFLEKGKLHLVAKPGPIHEKRIRLALTDREKLRNGLESKVILRLTPDDFALDVAKLPRVQMRMAPV